MAMQVRRVGSLVLGLLAVSLLALAVACGGGGDDDDGGSSGPGGALGGGNGSGSGSGSNSSVGSGGGSGGSCSVKLTGDVSGDFKGTGDSGSVGTDYWLTDDELRQALTFLQQGSDAEKKKKVDEEMAKDPRFFLLILNCEADKVSISLLPSGDSKYKDLPFKKAGEYPIPAGGPLGGAAKPGEFNVLVTIDDNPYQVTQAGSLKISKFDETGIAGTFQFGVQEAFSEGTAKKAQVSGQFSYPCRGGKVCK